MVLSYSSIVLLEPAAFLEPWHGIITPAASILEASAASISKPVFVLPIARTVDSKIFEAVPMMLGWSDNREESYWPSS